MEWLQSDVYPMIDSFSLDIDSILRTLVEHTATQIVRVLNHHHLKQVYILVEVFNSFLMSRIEALLGTEINNLTQI